jgi:hypothetical protein
LLGIFARRGRCEKSDNGVDMVGVFCIFMIFKVIIGGVLAVDFGGGY